MAQLVEQSFPTPGVPGSNAKFILKIVYCQLKRQIEKKKRDREWPISKILIFHSAFFIISFALL